VVDHVEHAAAALAGHLVDGTDEVFRAVDQQDLDLTCSGIDMDSASD